MPRGSRRKAAPTNQASTQSGQGTLAGTTSGNAAKRTTKRRSYDEIEADLQTKLEAVQAKRRIEKIAGNKPLVAAIKASKRLHGWLTPETYETVQTEISMVIDGKAGWIEDLGDERPADDDANDDADQSDDGASA